MLLQNQFEHLGAFRLPRLTTAIGQKLAPGGDHIALDKESNTLYVSNRNGFVAEVVIPEEISPSLNILDLSTTTFTQPFADATLGKRITNAAIGGLLVVDNVLFTSYSNFYDGLNAQRRSHFWRSKDLSRETGDSDFSSIYNSTKQGYLNGPMCHIPARYQEALGGDIIVSQFGQPLVARTSWGPAAFAVKSENINFVNGLIPAIPLLFYPSDHPTLGPWSGSSEIYGATSRSGGVAIIDDKLLFFGSNGTGKYTYGPATADANDSRIGTALDPNHPNDIFAYDPSDQSKGPHAWPYRYQVWEYDMKDIIDVAKGDKAPWEPLPKFYPFDLPVSSLQIEIRCGSIAYDEANRLLYVSQVKWDKPTINTESQALINVFKVKELVSEPEPLPSLESRIESLEERYTQLEETVNQLINHLRRSGE